MRTVFGSAAHQPVHTENEGNREEWFWSGEIMLSSKGLSMIYYRLAVKFERCDDVEG